MSDECTVVIIEESDSEDDDDKEEEDEVIEETSNDARIEHLEEIESIIEYDSYVFKNRKQQDDPFEYLMRFSIDLFDSKSLQWLATFSFWVHFSILFCTIYNLITNLDLSMMFKYATSILVNICALCVCWYTLPLRQEMKKIRNILENGALDPELYPQKTQDFLHDIAPMIKLAYGIGTCCVSLAIISVIFIMQTMDDPLLHTAYLKEEWNNPDWFYYLEIVFDCTSVYIVLMLMGLATGYHYFLLESYIHSITLRDYFEAIEEVEEQQDTEFLQDEDELTKEEQQLERPDNVEYQKEITRRLKFCLHLYNHLRVYKYEVKKVVFSPLLVFTAVFAVMIFTIMYQLMLTLSPEIYLICTLQIFVVVLSCIGGPIEGQIISDEGELVNATVWNASWYQWNIPNQKMVLFAMISTIKPSKVAAGNLAVLDHTMIIRLLRYIYTLFTVMNLLKDMQT